MGQATQTMPTMNTGVIPPTGATGQIPQIQPASPVQPRVTQQALKVPEFLKKN